MATKAKLLVSIMNMERDVFTTIPNEYYLDGNGNEEYGKYIDDFSRALVANKAGVLDLSPLGTGDETSGPVDPVDPVDPDPIDEGYFANQVQATGDVDTANLIFSKS